MATRARILAKSDQESSVDTGGTEDIEELLQRHSLEEKADFLLTFVDFLDIQRGIVRTLSSRH